MNTNSVSSASSRKGLTGGALVAVISVIAALGGLLFGYDTGIIGVALLGLGDDFQVTDQSKELVTSAIVAGALVGCIGTGPISDRLGRRRATMLVGLVFVIGSLMSAATPSIAVLILARFLLGLATGSASQIIPVYIAEVTPPKHRGTMVVMFQFMVVLGICFAYLWGYILGHEWRWMFFLGVIPAVILMIGMIVLPESPRWLVSKKRNEEALGILTRVRGEEESARVELKEIEEVANQPQGSWKDLLTTKWLRPAIIVGFGIAMFSQITGNNAIIYYAPTILHDAGFSDTASVLAPAGGAVLITITTLVGSLIIDKVGRRRYLLTMIPGSVIALVILGFLFHGSTGDFTTTQQSLIVVCLIAYLALNCGGFGVCIWLIISEVFPLYVRSKGASIGAFSHWAFNLIVSLTTLSMIAHIGLSYAMWVYAAISVLAVLFVIFMVPETAGRSLEEIEHDLRHHRFFPSSKKRSR